MNRRDLVALLGAALVSLPSARAQQKPMPMIGFLGTTSSNARSLAAFGQTMYRPSSPYQTRDFSAFGTHRAFDTTRRRRASTR